MMMMMMLWIMIQPPDHWFVGLPSVWCLDKRYSWCYLQCDHLLKTLRDPIHRVYAVVTQLFDDNVVTMTML